MVTAPDRALLTGSRSVLARPGGEKRMPSPSGTARTYTRISSTSPRRRHWPAAGCRSCSTPSHRVERNGGKTGRRRALRACAGSRRGRRGPPVLQTPALGAADSKRRDCPGVRGVLFEVPEASMSAAAARRLTQLHGELTSLVCHINAGHRRYRTVSGHGHDIRHAQDRICRTGPAPGICLALRHDDEHP
jgi:hypothetical protein